MRQGDNDYLVIQADWEEHVLVRGLVLSRHPRRRKDSPIVDVGVQELPRKKEETVVYVRLNAFPV